MGNFPSMPCFTLFVLYEIKLSSSVMRSTVDLSWAKTHDASLSKQRLVHEVNTRPLLWHAPRWFAFPPHGHYVAVCQSSLCCCCCHVGITVCLLQVQLGKYYPSQLVTGPISPNLGSVPYDILTLAIKMIGIRVTHVTVILWLPQDFLVMCNQLQPSRTAVRHFSRNDDCIATGIILDTMPYDYLEILLKKKPLHSDTHFTDVTNCPLFSFHRTIVA